MKNQYCKIKIYLIIILIVQILSCMNVHIKYEVPGNVFYIIEENNEYIIGYKDDSLNLSVDVIIFEKNKLKLKHRYQNDNTKFRYFEIKNEQKKNKYNYLSKEILNKKDQFFLNDKIEKDKFNLDFFDTASTKNDDRIILLFNWEDGHSFFDSQIVLINKNKDIEKIRYIFNENERKLKYANNVLFIDEEHIMFSICSSKYYNDIMIFDLKNFKN